MPESDSVTRRRILQVAGAGTLGALGAGEAAARPERYIVGTRSRAAERAARSRAASVHRVLDFGDIGKAVAGRFSPQSIDDLRRRRDVRYVEVDGTMEAIAQTLPWGVDRVDADVVHESGDTGDGADIAIIDSGIDSDHPDLQANLGAGTAFVKSRGPYAEKWDDDNGHGTHCAGIADAVDDGKGVVGVSTQATLHAVKVLDNGGSGSFSDVAAGIEYVADQGWDVGSMSLGASSGSRTVKDACTYATGKGVLLVAAAGNSGPCSDCVGYPAAYSEVIAVSATDRDDSLASYSSTGPEVEIAAPGTGIYSTYAGGGYETLSGTSMACPHVAGAAGLLMANGYSNTEARSRLKSSAESIGLASNEQGAGLLDVGAAVGSVDAAPSVSWNNPADGDTVSGTISVKIDATDTEDTLDSLTVEYRVDGGSWRGTSLTSGGTFTAEWDTTTVGDGDHSLEARATDSAGNTSTATIAVTVDNIEQPPSVNSLSVTEVEDGSGDTTFEVDWAVGDADGNLSTVDLTLTQDSDGSTEDSTTITVDGDSASGTTPLVASGDDGSGNSYTVELVVKDDAGKTDSGTATVTESEPTQSSPTIDAFSVSPGNTKNPHAEIDVDWSVSDADGNLDTVTVVVEDADESETFSNTTSVSGSSASGSDSFEDKHDSGTYDVTLTVTDAAGGTASDTKSLDA